MLRATAELIFERGYGGAAVDESFASVGRRENHDLPALAETHGPFAGRRLNARHAAGHSGGRIGSDDGFTHLLRSAKWTLVLPSIIDAAERDSDIAAMHGKFQQAYSAHFEAVIQRAMRKGELVAESADVAMLVASLTGPLFYRRWFSREPLTEDFANQIVLQVLR